MKNNQKRSSSNMPWVIASVALFVILVIYIFANPPSSTNASWGDDTVVARVNGVEITQTELYNNLLAAYGTNTLNSMISGEVARQALEQEQIEVSEAEVDESVNEIKETYGYDDEMLSQLLSYQGSSIEQLRADLRMELQLNKLFEPQVSVTEEEIQAYYDENPDDMIVLQQLRASHIVVETNEEAEALLAELQNGADFADLAQEHSIDESTSVDGGDLGYFTSGQMPVAFEEAAFSMVVGQTSEVVESTEGFHIILLTDNQPEHSLTVDEAREDIIETLKEEKIWEMSSAWFEEKSAAATVETYID